MHITDLTPRHDNTTIRLNRAVQSVSGKAWCCTMSPDGSRCYLGGHSGVWRSSDGGVTWTHLEWPQPAAGTTAVPGALLGTTIYDIRVSHDNPAVVFAAVGRDARRPPASGIWRSVDSGETWTRVHQFVRKGVVEQANCIAQAPDTPDLLLAAGGFAVARSRNGGQTWAEVVPQSSTQESVWYVAVGRRRGRFRFAYAVGSRVWVSTNGGLTWRADPHPLSLGAQGGAPGDAAGPGAQSIAVHPRTPNVLYVATFERNADINNSEGIVWRGEFSTSGQPARWTRLPPIPLDYPGVTDSGGSFVVPHVDEREQLYLIASDRRTVHLAFGEPATSADWVRIEDANCHVDPHGLAVSRRFARQRPGGTKPPALGRILLANDGGAVTSTDGAKRWTIGQGLATLGLVNVAVNPRQPKLPALCFGTGDNNGFSSADGGTRWETQDYVGGDNDCAFADPRQPRRLLVFAPRDDNKLYAYASGSGAPDASFGTSDRRKVPYPPRLAADSTPVGRRRGSIFVSNFVNLGYRPLVLTPANEVPPAELDVVTVRYAPTEAFLMRTTRLAGITSPDDWVSAATADGPGVKAFQQGPVLPSPNITVVQASGGHADPTFYVGDLDDPLDPRFDIPALGRVWSWRRGQPAWRLLVTGQRVPAGRVAPSVAQRFFVDPYRPAVLYVLGSDHVYRSGDGGTTWVVDRELERAMTEDGAFPIAPVYDGNPGNALIRDMLFDPDRPTARFAVGPAGVFQTLDGARWTALFRTSAGACRVNNAAYDFASCPRALYLATTNRGLLRLGPLEPDWDYPMDSLQVAEGRVTLLRVHDVGTGFGPAHDQLDAEVVAALDTEPEKFFGFKLRTGADRRVATAMLDLLRDAFNRDRPVRLEFLRTGCRTGRIVRVITR